MYPVVTAPGVADSNVCAVGLVVFGPTFTEQMRLYISEQERRLYTGSVPQYTQPAQQYAQPAQQYTQPAQQYTQPVPPAGIFSGYDSKPSAYESVAAPQQSVFSSVVSRLNPEQRYLKLLTENPKLIHKISLKKIFLSNYAISF